MAYRARYAYNLSFKGKDVSTTYGVMRMLMSLVKRHKPHSVVFCWDGGTPLFRRKLIPSYKSGRKHDDDPTRPVFLEQLRELEKILPHTGALQVKRKGIEADDLMAQAARMLGECLIISTDDDMLQCVDRKVSVLKPGKKDRLITEDTFEKEIGYPPFKHVLAKVLMGDGSDNVPGVRGIGPKTVRKLLANDNVLDAASPKLRERIEAFVANGNYSAAFTVIDLSIDLAGARKVLLDAEWTRYDNSVMQWCMERAFTSIVEAGSLGAIFGQLRKPEFDNVGVVIPTIWDYKRYPVESM